MARTMNLGFSDLESVYNISFPVGPNMPNARDDVLLVQTLMKIANFIRYSPGLGPVESSRKIKVDGYFGPQTNRLIVAFEAYVRERRRLIVGDGIFEPSSADGFTRSGILFKIIHLNRFAKEATPYGNEFNQLPADPGTHGILRASLLRKGH